MAVTSAEPLAIGVSTFDMDTGEQFPLHVHEVPQLIWAAEGVVTVTTKGGCWVLPPNLAMVMPAEVGHATSATRATRMYGVYLESERAPRWTAPQVIAIDGLLAALLQHLAEDEPPADAYRRCEAVVFDLLRPVSVTTIRVPEPTDPRARRIAERLRRYPADDRSLDEWGRLVGAGARTLSRLFVEETGMSFGRWRTQSRLRSALERLADGAPVARVAREVGYRSPSAFVAAFRQATGTTPNAYFASGDYPAKAVSASPS
jgi:AraC-like DNA-binding protein